MVSVYERKQRQTKGIMETVLELRIYEVTVQCPVCYCIETLELTGGRPFASGKWDYTDGEFLHRCCNYPFLFDLVEYNYLWQHHPAKVLRWS